MTNIETGTPSNPGQALPCPAPISLPLFCLLPDPLPHVFGFLGPSARPPHPARHTPALLSAAAPKPHPQHPPPPAFHSSELTRSSEGLPDEAKVYSRGHTSAKCSFHKQTSVLMSSPAGAKAHLQQCATATTMTLSTTTTATTTTAAAATATATATTTTTTAAATAATATATAAEAAAAAAAIAAATATTTATER